VYLGIVQYQQPQCTYLKLVMHFVGCGIEFTVLVIVVISSTMAAHELFDLSTRGSSWILHLDQTAL
jgi:hypothetical protein